MKWLDRRIICLPPTNLACWLVSLHSVFFLSGPFFCRVCSDRLVTLKWACLLQLWLTHTPIFSVLTPNFTADVIFVLRAKCRYRRSLRRAKQLFKKIDDWWHNCCLLLTASSPQLPGWIITLRIKTTGSCSQTHTPHLLCTYFVKFGFPWNDWRCRFLGPCALTAHLSNNLWG